MRNWSFQLYSAREFLPLRNNLRMLAEIGYTQVEGYGEQYNDLGNLKTMLHEYGLTMPTGHFDMNLLHNSYEGYEIAEKLNMKLIVCPYLTDEERPRDTDGWKYFRDRLIEIGERCRQAGFGFAWHNHDFEFNPLPDGQIPMKILLEQSNIKWQMDLAGLVRRNEDPRTWIKKYGNKICAVHLKDIAPFGNNVDEDGWADVGYGIIDWLEMYNLLEKTPAEWFILEHDKPINLQRFAKRSIDTVRSFGDTR